MNSTIHDNLTKEVLGLFAARKGHFRFESGHHGDLWLEIPPAYVHPKRLRRYAIELAKLLSPHRIEAVCGPLVEGAFIAQMVAEEMDVEFYFAEQFTRDYEAAYQGFRGRAPSPGALFRKRGLKVGER